MIKLYRKSGGRTEYWESWTTPTHVVIHSGSVGEKGNTKELPIRGNTVAKTEVENEQKQMRSEGFSEIEIGEMAQIVIQYRIAGMGSPKDIDKAEAIEGLMNEHLGWTGLGACDGHDIGSGTLNIFCDVVDGAIAEKSVINCLGENNQLTGSVIARRERTGDEDFVVFWPEGFNRPFELM